MPAIRRQGRRFFCWGISGLLRWLWEYFAASVFARTLCFAPSGESLFQTPKSNQKACPGIRVPLRGTPLAPSKFQGHATTGRPWPIVALATSMSLNP